MREPAFVLSKYRCTLCTSVFLFVVGQGDEKRNEYGTRAVSGDHAGCVHGALATRCA